MQDREKRKRAPAVVVDLTSTTNNKITKKKNDNSSWAICNSTLGFEMVSPFWWQARPLQLPTTTMESLSPIQWASDEIKQLRIRFDYYVTTVTIKSVDHWFANCVVVFVFVALRFEPPEPRVQLANEPMTLKANGEWNCDPNS
ncbi:hypothetical protein BLOT_004093 [Blomia tropicalis]|nr:hypothetical protein BLOT_004093 [Blomia tropicalis]